VVKVSVLCKSYRATTSRGDKWCPTSREEEWQQ
jgi:hypothetical protein